MSAGGRTTTWRPTLLGVRVVARLELRQRVRSTRWVVVLVVWFAVLGVLSALIRYGLHRSTGLLVNGQPSPSPRVGATIFGLVVFLVLSLGALVAPALSATSINGDRTAGVLATLQTTLLSPADLVVGKLLAAWTTSLALLVTASPFLLWAYFDGGTPVGRLLTTLVVLALTLLVVCAIGLGYSALTARTSSSAVLTYLTVSFLGLGLPLLFLLLLPTVTTVDTVVQRTVTPDGLHCVSQTVRITQIHTSRIWWLLAPSPYVVVADASPKPAGDSAGDPLSLIRAGVREARLPPPVQDFCPTDQAQLDRVDAARQGQRDSLGPTWPYGLAVDLAVALGFSAMAVRRLRAPVRRLPRGTRIA